MLSTVVAVLLTVFITYYALQHCTTKSDLPRYGRSGWIGSLLTAVKFAIDSSTILEEGWKQSKGRPFLVSTPAGPRAIVGPEYIEMLRKCDDTIFSQPIAVKESLQLDHTMDKFQVEVPYHLTVIRTDMTRALASYIPEMLEETELSMREKFDPSNDFSPVCLPVFQTLTHMIGRISNRAMLGPELCRNDDLIHKFVHFAETLVIYAQLLRWFPTFLRPPVYYFISSLNGGKKEPKKILIPYIEQYLQERENPDERRNNIVECIIRNAPAHDPAELALRVINVNFAGIHTSSIYLSFALFELCVMPESDLQSIRAEVLGALESEGGWNKPALAKFWKIDSLLKEVGRVYGLRLLALNRLTLSDAELDDGTQIPKGVLVSVYLKPVHFNPEIYPNPYEFDAFRFSRIREESNSGSISKHNFTAIDDKYLAFSAGRHACPGRFFAAMELKMMIAHLLLNYDISLPPGGTTKPGGVVFDAIMIPDQKAKIIVKRKLQPVTFI